MTWNESRDIAQMKINAKIAISKMVWTLSAGLRLANVIHGDKQVTKINLLKFS